VVRADLGRDADVLAVQRGHPACASGVSRAAARGIAAGTVRTWSAAGVPTPASGDAIALRRAGTGTERSVEPRFGADGRLPTGPGRRPTAACQRPRRGALQSLRSRAGREPARSSRRRVPFPSAAPRPATRPYARSRTPTPIRCRS
jgi:hypothetical protein